MSSAWTAGFGESEQPSEGQMELCFRREQDRVGRHHVKSWRA